jgi:thiol:disulfide interchange protein DsbA
MGSTVTRRGRTAFALLAAALTFGAAHSAPLLLVEGQSYVRQDTPEPVVTGKKIEVLEVFSYGCIHCFEFEPAMREWKQRIPQDVQLVYMPATFNTTFAMYARGYYAAESLGVASKLHEQVFDTVWKNQLQAQDMNQLANLYLQLGVDRKQFLAAANSAAVDTALTDATAKAERLKVAGTPALYVDGKYQVLLTGITSYGDIIQRLDALILKARAERKHSH